MADRNIRWAATAALLLLAPSLLATEVEAATVAPIVTVSAGGNTAALALNKEYDFSINLNPQSNTYYYASGTKTRVCGSEHNPSGNYCAHDATDKIIPGSTAISSVSLDGMEFDDGLFISGVYLFSLMDNVPSSHELHFIETFSANRTIQSYYYGYSNPLLDGYRTDLNSLSPNAPANFAGLPLSCSFSATTYGSIDTTANCSFKFSFVAPPSGGPTPTPTPTPTPGPVSSVPEPATWTMLIAGFGLIGAAMRRRRPASAQFA